jgi:hypothetical protein
VPQRAAGIYTVQWNWPFKANNAETYTSCADIQILAAGNVDCIVSTWSSYSQCSSDCGGGTITIHIMIIISNHISFTSLSLSLIVVMSNDRYTNTYTFDNNRSSRHRCSMCNTINRITSLQHSGLYASAKCPKEVF